jgi:hypothetical protein
MVCHRLTPPSVRPSTRRPPPSSRSRRRSIFRPRNRLRTCTSRSTSAPRASRRSSSARARHTRQSTIHCRSACLISAARPGFRSSSFLAWEACATSWVSTTRWPSASGFGSSPSTGACVFLRSCRPKLTRSGPSWGLGRTETPKNKSSRGIPEWASIVEEILDLLGIQQCSVMAHSAGAPYALSFANRVPDRIRGDVLLLAPWVGGVDAGAWLYARARSHRLT